MPIDLAKLLQLQKQALGNLTSQAAKPVAPVNPQQKMQFTMQNGQVNYTNPYDASLNLWRQTTPLHASGLYYSNTINNLGEKLPYGALGWDYNSNPYYGEGLAGEINKIWSTFTAPIGQAKQPWFKATPTNFSLEKYATMVQKNPLSAISYALGSLKFNVDLTQWFKQPGDTLLPTERKLYEGGTPFTLPARVSKVAIEAVLFVFNEPAIIAKKAVSVLSEDVTLSLPQYSKSGRFRKRFSAARPSAPAIPDPAFIGYIKNNSVDWSRVAQDSFANEPLQKVLTGQSPFVKGSPVDLAWQSGRVFYSSFGDPTVRAEFVSRYKSGESALLLQNELENPWAEMAGEIFFDPFNLVDFLEPLGIGSKVARHNKWIKNAESLLYDLAPEVSRVFDVGQMANEADAISFMAKAVDAQKANATRISEKLIDYSKASGLFAYTADGARHVVNSYVGDLVGQLLATAEGNADDMGEIVRALYLSTGNKSNITEAFRIVGSKNFPAPKELIFSEAGTMASMVMRHMFETADEAKVLFDDLPQLVRERYALLTKADDLARGAQRAFDLATPAERLANDLAGAVKTTKDGAKQAYKLLKEAATNSGLKIDEIKKIAGLPDGVTKFMSDLAKAQEKGIQGVIEFARERYLDYFEKMIPTVDQRIKLAEDIAKGIIPNPTPAQIKLSQVSEWQKTWNRIYQSTQVIQRPINTFFGYVYLGFSPGYAARNMMQNVLQQFVDYGAKSFNFVPDKAIEWAGDAPPLAYSEGFGSIKSISMTENTLTKLVDTLAIPKKLAQKAESYSSKMVVAHLYQESMLKMMKPGAAIPDMKPLLDAGMSPELTRRLWHTLIENKGNVNKTVEMITNALEKGFVDNVISSSIFEKADIDLLQKNYMFNDIMTAIRESKERGDTLDEMLETVDKIWRDRLETAQNDLKFDPAGPSLDGFVMNVLGDQINELNKVFDGEDTTIRLANNRFTATENAIDALKNVMNENLNAYVGEIVDTLTKGGLSAEEAKALGQRLENGRAAIALLNGTTGGVFQQTMKASREFRDTWVNTMRTWEAMANTSKGVNIKKAWGKLSDAAKAMDMQLADIIPETFDEFKRAFWEEFFFQGQGRLWINNGAGKQGYVDYLDNIVREMMVKLDIPETPRIISAFDNVELARKYQQDAIRWMNSSRLAYRAEVAGNTIDAIRGWANAYGVATKANSGANLDDDLLRIINKYSGTKYSVLDDTIPLDKAKEALIKYYNQIKRGKVKIPVNPVPIKSVVIKNINAIDNNVRLVWEQYERILKVDPTKKEFALERYFELLNKVASEKLVKPSSDYDAVLKNLDEILKSGTPDQKEQAIQEMVVAKYWNNFVNASDDVARQDALARYAQAVREFEDWKNADIIDNLPVPLGDGHTMTRYVVESKQAVEETMERIYGAIRDNYGKQTPVIKNPDIPKALADWAIEAKKRVAVARTISGRVATEGRNFTLLAYPEKRNIDLATAMVIPYQFWYSRTYANWMKRGITSAPVIAAYAKYKDALADIHAGSPDWWKYNVNSNELLGLDSENPLFFNLEATLNPLYGVTGVDFNDPRKRINFWTATLDDMGKFGPSIWTPISLGVAYGLYSMGEKEAAMRWGGRLIPQTQLVKTLLNAYGANIQLPGMKAPNEFDPVINMLTNNGYDPYELRKINRALGSLIEEGYDRTEVTNQAYAQKGELWDLAVQRAYQNRLGGQLSSFFLGVGFKGRNATDMQIDAFYNDLSRIYAMKDNYSPGEDGEFGSMMNQLFSNYPFGEMLILSNKNDALRDTAYVWNVAGRIAPGQKSAIWEAYGIQEIMDKFYSEKGMTGLTDSEKEKLMNSIVSIGAITKIPDNATRQEWKSASEKYKQMSAQIDKIFGENTSVLIDQYFSMKGDATDWNEQQAAYKFLDIHPQIQQALDWQAKTILSDPIMSKYYASINTIESYVKSTMNSALVKKYGQNLIDMVAVYNDMKRNGLDDEAKALAKANPEIWNYFDDYYDVWLPLVDSKILELANNLKPGTMTQLMENVSYDTMQQGMQEATKEQKQYYQFTWKEWQDQMSPALARIAEDFIVDGEDINDTSQRALERLADKYGISYYELLAALQYAYPSSYQNR